MLHNLVAALGDTDVYGHLLLMWIIILVLRLLDK